MRRFRRSDNDRFRAELGGRYDRIRRADDGRENLLAAQRDGNFRRFQFRQCRHERARVRVETGDGHAIGLLESAQQELLEQTVGRGQRVGYSRYDRLHFESRAGHDVRKRCRPAADRRRSKSHRRRFRRFQDELRNQGRSRCRSGADFAGDVAPSAADAQSRILVQDFHARLGGDDRPEFRFAVVDHRDRRVGWNPVGDAQRQC